MVQKKTLRAEVPAVSPLAVRWQVPRLVPRGKVRVFSLNSLIFEALLWYARDVNTVIHWLVRGLKQAKLNSLFRPGIRVCRWHAAIGWRDDNQPKYFI